MAFLEFGGDREYYLASAADSVYLLPSSPLDLTGVASYEIFLRGALDKLGVQPDFLHIGDYKTAPNQLTEKEMTPAHREMTESINRDTYDRLVAGIAEARELTEDQVRALMDSGPLLACRSGGREARGRRGLRGRARRQGAGAARRRRSRGPARGGRLSAVARLRIQRLPPRRPPARGGALRRRHDRVGPRRLRRHRRRAGRLRFVRRRDSPHQERLVHPRRGAADRQPGRLVGGVRRHLARADAAAPGQPVAAARRVDGRTSRPRAATTSPRPPTKSWRSPPR